MTREPTAARPDVVGRERELSQILAFLDRIPDGPAALVLHGEAGIGKTTLWRYGVAQAQERGWRTLAVRPAEAEARLSFAGLGDLLKGTDETIEALPDPQRHALDVALLRAEPVGPPPDPRAVFAAVLQVFRELATDHPLLVALDDAQWLDHATRDGLASAIRRLEDEPIGVLIALRSAEPRIPLGLARSLPEPRVARLPVEPLAPEELNDLLRARLGASFPPSTFKQLYEMAGGNPFFALEIGRATLEGDRRATGMALPVPRSLREDVLRQRVDALPSQVRETLLYASATSRPSVSILEAAVGRSPIAPQLEKASAAGIVQVDDDRVSFVHPLYGSAIYADASREHRHRVHRRLADVVDGREERARHLALSADGPDPTVADELEAAARLASERASPIAAAELYELAERLTSRDDADDRRRRLLGAADRWAVAGDRDRAEALLERVLTTAASGRDRAEALWRLALLYRHDDPRRAAAVSSQALGQGGVPVALVARLRTLLAWGLGTIGELADAELQADQAVADSEEAGDPVLAIEALDAAACVLAWRGDRASHDRMRRAEGFAAVSREAADAFDGMAARRLLLELAGAFGEVDERLAAMLERSRDRGDELATIELLAGSADVRWRAGDWSMASASLAALERADPDAIWLFATRARVEAYRGDGTAALADAERALDLAERTGAVRADIAALHAIGHLRLSQGDVAAATMTLARAWDAVQRCGFRDPADVAFVPDHVETLIELGRHDEAEPIVAWLEERGRTLDSPYALAVGERCRGLLRAGRGDLPGALQALDEALKHHDRVAMPFELARTHLVLGALRRRAKQKRSAREALQRALESFETLGAQLWAERARAEIARIGGRRPVVGELTESERRVAALAAAGRTNREIADTLFASVRTVEGHLSHVYAKLGIRSRTELAVFLDEPDDASER